MSYVIVDVESDGPIPAEFSMVCFGAVLFDDRLDQSFYGKTRPTLVRPTMLSGTNLDIRVVRILQSKLVS